MVVATRASALRGLRCRACGALQPADERYVCGECLGPIEPDYDLGAFPAEELRTRIAGGPASLWRYAPLLPVSPPETHWPVGWTPLLESPRLGAAIGVRRLLLKDDTRNPSLSFKDRPVAVALARALELGLDTLACASTGNLAGAVAAAAARNGLRAFVFVPADTEPAKVAGAAAYGATVVRVRGTYDQVNRLCATLADELGWGFVNFTLRPYYAEGSKTLLFEVAEQLGWRLPDHVVVPVASGALMTKIHRAFRELAAIGAVEEAQYRISGAQAEGCSPVAQAFAANADEVRPVKPNTIAKSLAIGNPADGRYAIQTARGTGGAIDACTEGEVLEGLRLLAETEGVFTETAGGVTIAVLKRLVESGVVKPDEETVALVTGNGYKTIEALEGTIEPSYHVAPDLDEFLAALRG